MRTVLLLLLQLLVLPLAFVGPTLLPGQRCLPILPVAFEPLALEDPDAARAAREAANHPASDRGLTGLTDDIAMRSAWRSGTLPTWEPRLGLGLPLAAGSARGAWYPPNALAWLLSPDVAAGLRSLGTLFLAGLGMLAFLRARGLRPIASLFGAWAFQAGGFALVNLHVSMRVDAALWLPLGLLGIERLLSRQRFARPRFGGPLVAAALALSWLAGFPPIAVFVTASIGFYAVWRAVEMRSAGTLRRSAGMAARSAGWIAVGVLAASVAWIPMLEASRQSLRTRQVPELTAAQALPLSSAGTLLVPDLFGRPSDSVSAAHGPVTWWLTPKADIFAATSADAIDWNLFAGVGVLVLAIAGVLARPRAAAFPFALLLLALGFVQGWPLVRLLDHVPGFDLGPPSRAASIAWVCWPILAALGLDALIEKRARAARTVLVAGVVLVIGAGFAALAFDPAAAAQRLPHTLAARHGASLATVASVVDPASLRAGFERLQSGLVQLALVAAGVLAALFLARRLARRGAFAAALPWLALTAVEGLLLARSHVATQSLDGRALFPRSVAMDAVAEAAGDGRIVRFDASPKGVDVQRLARPNLPQIWGIRDLTPSALFTPLSLVELVGTLDAGSLHGFGLDRISRSEVLDHRALDLLRVTCVLSREPLRSSRLRLTWSRPGFCVHVRSGSMPPARVVPPDAIVASARVSALQLVADPVRDPRAGIVIAAEDLPAEDQRPATSGGPFVPGSVEVESRAPDRLDARVTGTSGGWLVFQEQWYPGWKATVNGANVPVVRADHAFRAVAVPPGDSVVRTKYEPDSLRLGGALSLLACACAILIAIREARKSRPNGGPEGPGHALH